MKGVPPQRGEEQSKISAKIDADLKVEVKFKNGQKDHAVAPLGKTSSCDGMGTVMREKKNRTQSDKKDINGMNHNDHYSQLYTVDSSLSASLSSVSNSLVTSVAYAHRDCVLQVGTYSTRINTVTSGVLGN